MMTCQEMIDFLSDYLDGELVEDQQQTLDRHLAMCPECEAYLTSYRSTVELSKLVCSEDSEHPQAMPEDLVQAILEAHRLAG